MAPTALLLLVVLSVALGVPLTDPLGGPDGPDGLDDGSPPDAGVAVVCPKQCECRFDASPKLVNCSARGLLDFPEHVPDDVEYLDLSDNHLKAVPKFLPAWERLEALSLAGNRLTDFPPRALSEMPALELLDLSRNNIASLRHIKPDRFISENPLLQVLNLSGNGLQDLGHGSFQSLSSESLRVLDVSHCSVSSVNGEEALRELPSLRELRLAGNLLHELPVLSAPGLRELDVSGCRLRVVRADALAALPQLVHLAVSHNPDLAEFRPPPSPTPSPDDALAHLNSGVPPTLSSSLQILEAEGCALQDLSFMAMLPNLTEARLRGNSISRLEPHDLQDSEVLAHLDLADNKLEDIPEGFFKSTELLKELDLSGNRLTAIHPDTFSANAALRRLNVSRNPVVAVTLRAAGLRLLDLSHADVQLLAEDVLDGMPQLKHLNLSHNPLPQLPDRLCSAGEDSSLHSLDLSFCRLTDLSSTSLDALPLLQTLDLRGNRLTDPLKVEAFHENTILHNVALGDNPWRCDCRSKDFRAFVEFLEKHPAKENTASLTCHSPEAVQGQTWYDACLGPNSSALASLDTWVFVVILALSVTLVAGGVLGVRRLRQGKTRRRRQERQRERDEELRACEQEAAQRRLHRRMQQQQQEELRRQHSRPRPGDDPEGGSAYDPPSYEEAVLMDRMTQDDARERQRPDADDSDDEEGAAQKMIRGRHTPVPEEDEDEPIEPDITSGATVSSEAHRSNGHAQKFNTKL